MKLTYHVYGDYGYESQQELEAFDRSSEAIREGRLGAAICHLEKYRHPAPAAHVSSLREMLQAIGQTPSPPAPGDHAP